MSVYVVSLAAEFPNDNPALHAGVSWVCLSPTARPTPELSVHEPPPPALAATVFVPEPPAEIAETVAAPTVMATLLAQAAAALEILDAADVVETCEDAPEIPAPLESGILETPCAPTVECSHEEIVIEDLEPAAEVQVEGIVPVFESIAPPTIVEETRTSALPPASDDPFTTLVCTLADVAIGAGAPSVAAMLPGLLFDGRVSTPLEAVHGIWDGNELDPAFASTLAAWRAILRGTSEDFSDCGMLDEWASDLLARLLDAKDTASRLRQELRARGVAAFGLAA